MDWYQVLAICATIFLSTLCLVLVLLDTVRHHSDHWGSEIVQRLDQIASAVERGGATQK